MASARTIAGGTVTCIVVGLLGCGQSTHEAAPVRPPAPAVADERGSWVSAPQLDPMASEDDVVHDDPSPPLAAAALVQLADDAFAAGRLEESRALYEQVLVHHTDERHYARYKLGWIALDVDDGAAALAHFMAVIGEAGPDPRYRTLVENAAKDCVRAYARVGRPERARDFFARIDPPNAEALVERLVQIYEEEGRPEDAARALGIARK